MCVQLIILILDNAPCPHFLLPYFSEERHNEPHKKKYNEKKKNAK